MAPQALNGLLDVLRRGLRRGATGEALAARHLEEQGLVILAMNFRCRSGEVDIVAREGEAVAFVEVKERSGASHGEGYEAVGFGKRRRIVRAARLYAVRHGVSEGRLRFDVVSVEWGRDGRPRLRHDRAAFDEDGR